MTTEPGMVAAHEVKDTTVVTVVSFGGFLLIDLAA